MFRDYAELKQRIDALENSRAQVAANLAAMARRVHKLGLWVEAQGGDVEDILGAGDNQHPSEASVQCWREALAGTELADDADDNDDTGNSIGFSLN
jgi:hypothetical protein